MMSKSTRHIKEYTNWCSDGPKMRSLKKARRHKKTVRRFYRGTKKDGNTVFMNIAKIMMANLRMKGGSHHVDRGDEREEA